MRLVLLDYTRDPLKVMCAVKAKIEGKHLFPDDISEHQAEEEFIDSVNSGIYGMFEFASFTFDIMDVTRAFTHQLVRTRHASYMQESMRFSVHRGELFSYLRDKPTLKGDAIEVYDETMKGIQEGYEALLDMGVSPEDARGVLPTDIFTSICMKVDYRNLLHMAEQRMCLQSQSEHRMFMDLVKESIGSQVSYLMAKQMVPSCVRNGFCNWGGRLDRPCSMQKKYNLKLMSEVVGGK